MVPFDAFSTEAPQSSSAFCSGCAGGTQCEILSSKVLSCATAAGAAASESPVAAAMNAARSHCECIDTSLGSRGWRSGCSIDGEFFAIQTQLGAEVKKLVGYKTIQG